MRTLIFVSLMMVSILGHSKNYPQSDHFDGKTFHNPKGDHLHGLLDVLQWKLNAEPVEWPEQVENKNFKLLALSPQGKGVVTFINHATFLLQLPGLTVMTDPVYSERVSPVRFAGPKRVRLPGIPLDDIPPVDVIVISHNHYDHMDIETLKLLDGKFHPLIVVPLGNQDFLKAEGLQNVTELDWWQNVKIREHTITLTPAEHWSSRTPWDKNEALWGGFMIHSTGTKVFFAGDTGYGEHFRDIKSRLGAPDVALLPIGSYEPRYFMKYHHMNPEEAVKAHQDLAAGLSFGMHFGTFQLTDEGIQDPQTSLNRARIKYEMPPDAFRAPEQGESFLIP
jgi:L-ascorbate metabolism protein UlaG (beta-lactamase superfamily)